MKNIIIILLVSSLSISCKAQNIIPNEIKNSELNHFIGSIVKYQKSELKNNIIDCIIISNLSGSAGNSESDEVSNNIFISNCQYGELLDCKLYAIDNLININIESINENDTDIIVQITSGNFKERKISKIIIHK
jgi:hypothetical protein